MEIFLSEREILNYVDYIKKKKIRNQMLKDELRKIGIWKCKIIYDVYRE